MQLKKHALASISLIFACVTAYSQNLQCPDISKTLKEYSIDSSSSNYLNAVFTQHCQQDGSKKGSSGGVGLDAVIKAIPVKFTGNYTSSDEAFSNFCKTYASQTAASSATDSYKETISLKSLETIQQCLALQTSGTIVTHQISNVESANFYLRSSVTQNFELQGVQISGGTTSCLGQVAGQKMQFDTSINVKIKATQSFGCTRRGVKLANGALSFPESIVTVMTNQGNYALFWPKDERESADMASQIDQRITKIEGDLAVTVKDISPIVRGTAISIFKCPSGTAGVSKDASWMYVGCNGQISSESTCTNVWYKQPSQTLQCEPLGKSPIIK
jgi:hypothetical protein